MTTQTWLPVPGYEGLYEVSDHGNVRSVPRVVTSPRCVRLYAGTLLRTSTSPRGYAQVRLSEGGKSRSRTVHALVLEAFAGPRPDGLVACHADDNKADNSLANLRWDTHSANAADRVRNGKDGQAAKTHCKSGHEYTEENTYRSKKGRDCRTCRAARNHKSRERFTRESAA